MVMRIFRAFILYLLAMVGVAAILLRADLSEAVEITGLTEKTIILLSLLNNTLLVGGAVVIGALTAHRVGLMSLIAHRVEDAGRRLSAFPVYAALGVAFGLAVASADLWAFSNIEALKAFSETQSAEIAASNQPPEVRFLYGGITEEVLLRWGALSLIAWVIWAITKNRAGALWVAIPLAAFLFGAGHLPALYQSFEFVPGEMVARVILLNAALGIAYGVAYARNSLEAGMVAHAATHVGLLLASSFSS